MVQETTAGSPWTWIDDKTFELRGTRFRSGTMPMGLSADEFLRQMHRVGSRAAVAAGQNLVAGAQRARHGVAAGADGGLVVEHAADDPARVGDERGKIDVHDA